MSQQAAEHPQQSGPSSPNKDQHDAEQNGQIQPSEQEKNRAHNQQNGFVRLGRDVIHHSAIFKKYPLNYTQMAHVLNCAGPLLEQRIKGDL